MATFGPVTYETLRWTPRAESPYSRASRRSGPYQAAITPAIADLDLTLPPTALADMEDASHDITRFDAELGGEIAPFAAVLLRSESAASSRIENLTASARSIAEAELPGGKGKVNADLIVANTAAMTAAIALSDTIDADAILTMHAALMENEPRHTPGQWRDEQVWIGGGNSPLNAVRPAQPHPRARRHRRSDGLRRSRRCSPAGADRRGHAQFETIHPFTDGNGRTGRALVQAMLRNKGLTRQVTVPVSAGLLADTDGYIAALTAYRQGDVTPIVERFAGRVHGRPPTAGSWSPNCARSGRAGTTGSPPAPTLRCGGSPTCSPGARSSTACCCARTGHLDRSSAPLSRSAHRRRDPRRVHRPGAQPCLARTRGARRARRVRRAGWTALLNAVNEWGRPMLPCRRSSGGRLRGGASPNVSWGFRR